MDRTTSTERTPLTSLSDSFERYLQDEGRKRSGDGGNYRRNAARELERFVEWAAGDRGIEWLDGRHRLFDSVPDRFGPTLNRFLYCLEISVSLREIANKSQAPLLST